MNNLNKKNKFITNSCLDYNKQPYYEVKKNDTAQINIKKNNFNTKDKVQVVLKDNFDPYNYNLNYFNNIKKNKEDKDDKSTTYFSTYNQGPGRGVGNMSINNTIRLGDAGREDNNNFKSFKESEIIDRFDFIDNRFTNPINVVFPFPRSGENTRKVQTIDNQTNFINEYQWTTPNLVKKEVYQQHDKAYNFSYEPSELPNSNLINQINENNKNQRSKQKIRLDLNNRLSADINQNINNDQQFINNNQQFINNQPEYITSQEYLNNQVIDNGEEVIDNNEEYVDEDAIDNNEEYVDEEVIDNSEEYVDEDAIDNNEEYVDEDVIDNSLEPNIYNSLEPNFDNNIYLNSQNMPFYNSDRPFYGVSQPYINQSPINNLFDQYNEDNQNEDNQNEDKQNNDDSYIFDNMGSFEEDTDFTEIID
jgi:hypothetical protein